MPTTTVTVQRARSVRASHAARPVPMGLVLVVKDMRRQSGLHKILPAFSCLGLVLDERESVGRRAGAVELVQRRASGCSRHVTIEFDTSLGNPDVVRGQGKAREQVIERVQVGGRAPARPYAGAARTPARDRDARLDILVVMDCPNRRPEAV
jgi:hypothetical protein